MDEFELERRTKAALAHNLEALKRSPREQRADEERNIERAVRVEAHLEGNHQREEQRRPRTFETELERLKNAPGTNEWLAERARVKEEARKRAEEEAPRRRAEEQLRRNREDEEEAEIRKRNEEEEAEIRKRNEEAQRERHEKEAKRQRAKNEAMRRSAEAQNKLKTFADERRSASILSAANLMANLNDEEYVEKSNEGERIRIHANGPLDDNGQVQIFGTLTFLSKLASESVSDRNVLIKERSEARSILTYAMIYATGQERQAAAEESIGHLRVILNNTRALLSSLAVNVNSSPSPRDEALQILCRFARDAVPVDFKPVEDFGPISIKLKSIINPGAKLNLLWREAIKKAGANAARLNRSDMKIGNINKIIQRSVSLLEHPKVRAIVTSERPFRISILNVEDPAYVGELCDKYARFINFVPDQSGCDASENCRYSGSWVRLAEKTIEWIEGYTWNHSSIDEGFLNTTIQAIIAAQPSRRAAITDLFEDVITPDTLAYMIGWGIGANDIGAVEYAVEHLRITEPFRPEIAEGERVLLRTRAIEKIAASGVIDVKDLDAQSGEDFERLLGARFSSLGFEVQYTPISGDFGADLILRTRNHTRIVVQCKRFKSRVNLKAVQEVIGAISHYGADFGLVITNNNFLSSARVLADSSDVELWDSTRLLQFLTGDISFSAISEM